MGSREWTEVMCVDYSIFGVVGCESFIVENRLEKDQYELPKGSRSNLSNA